MNKILITTGIFPPDIGGPASYAMTLGKNCPKDVSITVITYSSKFNYSNDKELPFKVIRVWRKWPKGIKHLVYFFRVFDYHLTGSEFTRLITRQHLVSS